MKKEWERTKTMILPDLHHFLTPFFSDWAKYYFTHELYFTFTLLFFFLLLYSWAWGTHFVNQLWIMWLNDLFTVVISENSKFGFFIPFPNLFLLQSHCLLYGKMLKFDYISTHVYNCWNKLDLSYTIISSPGIGFLTYFK